MKRAADQTVHMSWSTHVWQHGHSALDMVNVQVSTSGSSVECELKCRSQKPLNGQACALKRGQRWLGLSAGKGIAEAVKAIRIERKGRDIYVMGAANVGKSAFVR